MICMSLCAPSVTWATTILFRTEKRSGTYDWVIVVLTPTEQFFSYIMARTSYIRWDYNDVQFILHQNAELEQQYTGRHVAPLGHINQSLLLFLNAMCLPEKQTIPNLLSLVRSDRISNRHTTVLKASILTITRLMLS